MYDSQKIFDDVVLGQYKVAPKFSAILQQIIDAHDISTDIATIHDVCFDLDTAVGVWLDLLGKKIGLKRRLRVNITSTKKFFGFAGNQNALSFNQAPFYSESFDEYVMNDEQYRAALKLKAESNYLNANVGNINYLLRKYFNRTDCFVKFFDVMEMAFCFAWTLELWEKTLLPLIFPIPAAVSFKILENYDINKKFFGFRGNPNAVGFNQAPFFSLSAPAIKSYLLTEEGDFILTENNEKIVL